MFNRTATVFPCGSNKWFSLRFSVYTRFRHETPGEVQRTYWPRYCNCKIKEEFNRGNMLSNINWKYIFILDSHMGSHGLITYGEDGFLLKKSSSHYICSIMLVISGKRIGNSLHYRQENIAKKKKKKKKICTNHLRMNVLVIYLVFGWLNILLNIRYML